MYKICDHCKESKPIEEFYQRSGRPSRRSECKPCHNARMSKWRNTARGKSSIRRRQLLDDCGISDVDYAELFDQQNGVCAICRKPETATTKHGEVKSLCVDHNHNTGMIRGLLCQKCNTALGLMEDNQKTLQSAIDYLNGGETTQVFSGRRLATEPVPLGAYT